MTEICSKCKEHCSVEYEDWKPISICCGKRVYDAPERDTLETPGGKLPYGGAK